MKVNVKNLERALEALSPAETDVLEGAWLRERMPGRRSVRAVATDKGVTLVSSDAAALDAVGSALKCDGCVIDERELPTPTRKDVADVFERALARGEQGMLRLLTSGAPRRRRAKKGGV